MCSNSLSGSAASSEARDRISYEAQLRESQRQLHAVLDNATVAIFLMDDRQHCIYMNRAAEALTGYTLAEVLALDQPLHDIIHHTYPDGRRFPLHECAIDRAFPEHNQTQGEEVFVHKDGTFYPVAFTASPIRDEASQTIGTIIEVRDIREEKAAQERQRLLINELNHRVKNTLATVQSIAAHTFKGADRTAREAFEGRLLALSHAHNQLTRESWAGASLATIVKAAVEPFNGPERFHLSGVDALLAPKMVVSLSMALHELATNATKYGALSGPGGQVTIHWNVAEAQGDRRLSITWAEHGGPAVSPPTVKGFGTRLIERQFAMEFDGKVELDFRPSGLVCTLDLRLPTLPTSESTTADLAAPGP